MPTSPKSIGLRIILWQERALRGPLFSFLGTGTDKKKTPQPPGRNKLVAGRSAHRSQERYRTCTIGPAAGTCPFCNQRSGNQRAGILSREHPECRKIHQAGWHEMVRLAWDTAKSHEFNANSLLVSLTEIARRSYGDASTVVQALEEGWGRAVRHAAAEGRSKLGYVSNND